MGKVFLDCIRYIWIFFGYINKVNPPRSRYKNKALRLRLTPTRGRIKAKTLGLIEKVKGKIIF